MLYELADLFRVFGDSTRIKILYALHDSELCVQDIADAVQLSQSAVSHQLRVLKDSKLVRFRRVMEKLDRGTVAVKKNDGVYLSWRLLGTESLTNQAFDIYRDSEKIYTTGEHDATCYTDSKGTADNKYTVVPKGEAIDKTEAVRAG